MNKKDIINAIHQNSNYTKREVEDIVNQVFDLIITGLQTEGNVSIHQFGRFEKAYISSYQGVHPITGEPIQVQGDYRVHFTSSLNLKKQLKK